MDDVSATTGSRPFAGRSAVAALSLLEEDRNGEQLSILACNHRRSSYRSPSISGQACSPAQVSLYEQFSKHSRVFLGTVEKNSKPLPGREVYTIFRDEAFKGMPDKGKGSGEIEVTLSESAMGAGRAGRRPILIFMNEGDEESATSHSRLVSREKSKAKTSLIALWTIW